MKDGLTEIICILDESASMSAVWDEAITGFNLFITEQKKIAGEAKVTVTFFNTEYRIEHNGVPLDTIPELTRYNYDPHGMTALLDAIGRTIDTVGVRLHTTPEEEKPEKVIMVILTDGEENSSKEYTRPMLLDKINHQRDTYKWEFVFLAANQDAFAAGSKIGVHHVSNFRATPDGTRKAYMCAARAVASYRDTGQMGPVTDVQ